MTADTSVPPGESPATCPYCDRPFPSAELLALHAGRAHRARLSDAERERVRAAEASEAEPLRKLQLRGIIWLVVLYFGLLFAYAAVT